MQNYFYQLADELTTRLAAGEVFLSTFSGEDSEFVRLNRSAVRQAGSVRQRYMTLDLIRGQRHAKGTVGLSGDKELDRDRLFELLGDLRGKLANVPDDPYLLYSTEVRNTEQKGENRLPDRDAALAAILKAGEGRDLVGIYAQGGIFAGFANSLGQRNWFSTYSHHLDWCFYHDKDKAVKCRYAGFEWDDEAFAKKVDSAVEQLAVLKQTPKTLSPGEYRVYLSPAALAEFVEMLCYGGFGMKAHRTKSTPLLKMVEEGAKLNPAVSFRENTLEGIDANFQSAGFVKPDAVTLMENGELRDLLVSPRSAKEYGEEPNGASSGESPDSLDMAAGNLAADEILEKLGTGLYVNDLWYLNYSDLPACRITGMTRFATFWVENGQIAAPVNVMRFDETAYRVLGENLIGLTNEREFLPSALTYGGRSTSSLRLPGALVDRFRFTL
jgi:predicted Zn-dependent protease